MSLINLAEAIKWASERWDQQRAAPIRLHEAHTTDGALGAPRFTFAFAAALDGSVNATSDATRTAHCHHPMLALGRDARDCPECYGLGVKDVNVDRYRFPMSRALSKLANTLRPRRQPHPYRLVVALAEHAWDWHATARSLAMHDDLAEALLLRALRQLHGRYEEGPVTVSYIDKSQSQQNAESWTAA